MSPIGWIAFVAAAAIGAPLRYLIGAAVARRSRGVFPWGTLFVNASGSLLFGFLAGLVIYHAFPASSRVVLGTGFCGAYTTFSTFTFETVGLVEQGAVRQAVRNALGTVVVCAGAAAVGLAVAAL